MELLAQERSLMISSAVWIQYSNVMDRWTDTGRQQRPCLCIASCSKKKTSSRNSLFPHHAYLTNNHLNHCNSLIISINLDNLIYPFLSYKYTYTFSFLPTFTSKQLVPFAHSTKNLHPKPIRLVFCTQATSTFLSSNTLTSHLLYLSENLRSRYQL